MALSATESRKSEKIEKKPMLQKMSENVMMEEKESVMEGGESGVIFVSSGGIL